MGQDRRGEQQGDQHGADGHGHVHGYGENQFRSA